MIVFGLGFGNIGYSIVGIFRVIFLNLIFFYKFCFDLYVFNDYLMIWFKHFLSILKI